MFDSTGFDTLAKKLYAALPGNIQLLEKEIQQQFKSILQATFSNLDLVTREEFDVQTKVLFRTREKIEALQAQVNSLLNEHKPT